MMMVSSLSALFAYCMMRSYGGAALKLLSIAWQMSAIKGGGAKVGFRCTLSFGLPNVVSRFHSGYSL